MPFWPLTVAITGQTQGVERAFDKTARKAKTFTDHMKRMSRSFSMLKWGVAGFGLNEVLSQFDRVANAAKKLQEGGKATTSLDRMLQKMDPSKMIRVSESFGRIAESMERMKVAVLALMAGPLEGMIETLEAFFGRETQLAPETKRGLNQFLKDKGYTKNFALFQRMADESAARRALQPMGAWGYNQLNQAVKWTAAGKTASDAMAKSEGFTPFSFEDYQRSRILRRAWGAKGEGKNPLVNALDSLVKLPEKVGDAAFMFNMKTGLGRLPTESVGGWMDRLVGQGADWLLGPAGKVSPKEMAAGMFQEMDLGAISVAGLAGAAGKAQEVKSAQLTETNATLKRIESKLLAGAAVAG